MKIGDRVKVKIVDPKTYAYGCAKVLNGSTGTVESVSKRYPTEGDLLVHFDEPVKWDPDSPRQSTGFWLPPCDLVLL